MRADDLTLEALFDAAPKGGIYRFAGERAVLLDTAALGLLRKELIDTLSPAAAHGVLYRFGWAHGFRTAEAMKGGVRLGEPRGVDQRGGRLHRLKGLVTFRPVPREAGAAPRHFSQAIWDESYEAEQHLLHYGLSDEPVCWTLTGFASGYLTACHGRPIRVVEETCVGKGDPTCRMAGEPEEAWDEATRRSRASLSDPCLEGELFGHARGAFSGASSDRPGLFEAAHGGTLLLDEIGEVPLGLQAKLLRALQEREVRRVGENRNRMVDVRVVAATNRDLAKEVETGHFRRDLFFRLRVIEIPIPALRERTEDVLPLAKALLLDAARRTGAKVNGFTPEAAHLLLRHRWPGNVRELANAVERAAVLADVERAHVLAVLGDENGHREKAAKRLGIGVATLYRKLKEWGEEGRPPDH